MPPADSHRDAMLVCRRGHVVTDRLHARPDLRGLRCDHCGAATLDRCRTCGSELPGAVRLPGPLTVGREAAPLACPVCGAAFPWSAAPPPPPPDSPLGRLDALLRRLPRAARALRHRHGTRPAFAVRDEYDLEDLARALLPLAFDDVRPVSRTPSYAAGTRTDFVLSPQGLVLTLKCASPAVGEAELSAQIAEDASDHDRTLVAFVYDAGRRLQDPAGFERAHSTPGGERPAVWCVVAG
jgi:hypothetical protein